MNTVDCIHHVDTLFIEPFNNALNMLQDKGRHSEQTEKWSSVRHLNMLNEKVKPCNITAIPMNNSRVY